MDNSEKVVLKLYNEEIKQQYLDELPQNKMIGNTTNLFKRFGTMMEQVLNKDLYDMSKEELLTVLPLLEIYDYTDLRVKMSFIINYIDWANSRNLTKDTVNYARSISVREIDIAKNLSKALIKDEQRLVDIIETACNLKEANNVPVSLCLFWLGFNIKECLEIKNEDMDWDNWTIKTKNKIIDIPDEFKHIFNEYKENKTSDKIIFGSVPIKFALINVGFFIEKLINTSNASCESIKMPITNFQLAIRISNFRTDYINITNDNVRCNPSSIILSGMFSKLYKNEQNGTVIDSVYIKRFFDMDSSAKIKDKLFQYQVYKTVFWGE